MYNDLKAEGDFPLKENVAIESLNSNEPDFDPFTNNSTDPLLTHSFSLSKINSNFPSLIGLSK